MQKKKGTLIVQVLTENGWEDLGKTDIDLHLIANDLQPIQVSAELEKCIVKGAYVNFVISPKLLDQALEEDDGTVGSMSEMSDMTGADSPSPSTSANITERFSLTKRLSQSMGLGSSSSSVNSSSSPSPSQRSSNRYLSTPSTSLPSPPHCL